MTPHENHLRIPAALMVLVGSFSVSGDLRPCVAAIYVVPSECCATIQAGIDQAASGDTVLVGPGTYQGPGNVELSFGGRDITLLGDSRDTVILDGEGTARIVHLHNGETVASRIESVTIANGWRNGSGSGGLRIDGAGLTLADCRVTDCYGWHGGGLYAAGSIVYLEDCIIEGNAARSIGGGIYVTQGSSITLTNTLVVGNDIIEPGGDGGGMGAYISEVIVENSIIGGNRGLYGFGGGMDLLGCQTQLRNSTIAGNMMVSSNPLRGGGGISVQGGSLSIDRCAFYDNCTFETAGEDLWCWGTTALISCSYIRHIYGTYQYDGPGIPGDVSTCILVDCNDAPTGEGDYSISEESALSPENNPCGMLIGALEPTCAVSDVGSGGAGVGRLSVDVRISPNPGQAPIAHFALEADARVLVEVWDASGRSVWQWDQSLRTGSHAVALNRGDRLVAGVYFVRVAAGQRIGNARVVVAR